MVLAVLILVTAAAAADDDDAIDALAPAAVKGAAADVSDLRDANDFPDSSGCSSFRRTAATAAVEESP